MPSVSDLRTLTASRYPDNVIKEISARDLRDGFYLTADLLAQANVDAAQAIYEQAITEVEAAVTIVAGAASYDPNIRKSTVPALLAATDTPRGVGATWWGGDNRYTELASGVSSYDLSTASGVRLNYLRSAHAVSVDSFGAIADGITDCTAAIQKAINYVENLGGGVVQFGLGRYLISNTLLYGTKVHLRGEGFGSELFLATGSNCDMLRSRDFYSHFGFNHFYVNSEALPWGYAVEGLCLNGNYSKDGGITGNISGKGFVGYGKMHHFWNVRIINTAERGYWHMCGNKVGQTDHRDLPEVQINVELSDCGLYGAGDHGSVFAGPHDAHYWRIVAVRCGKNTSQFGVVIYGDSLVTGGGRNLGVIHVYGGSGAGILITGSNATLQGGGLLIAETGLVVETPGNVITLQCNSANSGIAAHIKSSANLINAGRLGTAEISHSSLVVEGSNNIIHAGRIFPHATGTGDMIRNEGDNNSYFGLHLSGMSGGTGIRHVDGDNCNYFMIYITGALDSFNYTPGVRNYGEVTTSNPDPLRHFIGSQSQTDEIKVRGLDSSFNLPPLRILNTTAGGNIGTGSDTLIALNIPAGSFFRNNVKAKITAWGTTANNANTKTVTFEFGAGNTIVTQALPTGIAGTWRIEVEVVLIGTNLQMITSKMIERNTVLAQNFTGVGAQNTSAAISVRCRGSATLDNDIVQTGMLVEWEW